MEIIPGRVATLRLDGASGSLDLVVCYFDAGSSYERKSAASTISFPNSVALEGSSSGKKGPESATGASGAANRLRARFVPDLCRRRAGAEPAPE